MGIRIDHTHDDGKTCYVTLSRQRLEHAGIYSDIGRDMRRRRFGCAYMPYTGSWYAYDLETGKEIARFNREFYEQFIAPMLEGELVTDPECERKGQGAKEVA